MVGTRVNEAATFAGPRVTVIPKPSNTTVGKDSLTRITPHPNMQVVTSLLLNNYIIYFILIFKNKI